MCFYTGPGRKKGVAPLLYVPFSPGTRSFSLVCLTGLISSILASCFFVSVCVCVYACVYVVYVYVHVYVCVPLCVYAEAGG